MLKQILAPSLLGAALMGGTICAQAGSATGAFNVSATVLNNCSVSATDLTFGSYSPNTLTPTNMSTSLSVTCTSGLGYTIALNGGNSPGTVAARVMSDGASHSLLYQLYTAGDYASIFGDASSGSVTVAKTGSGAAQSIPVYGQILGGQYVPAGSYSDRISITVNY